MSLHFYSFPHVMRRTNVFCALLLCLSTNASLAQEPSQSGQQDSIKSQERDKSKEGEKPAKAQQGQTNPPVQKQPPSPINITIQFAIVDEYIVEIFAPDTSFELTERPDGLKLSDQEKGWWWKVLAVDKFGNDKVSALKAFQRALKLPDDGAFKTGVTNAFLKQVKTSLDTLRDSKTNTTYILLDKTVREEKIGWHINGKFLEIGQVRVVDRRGDTIKFFYRPRPQQKFATINTIEVNPSDDGQFWVKPNADSTELSISTNVTDSLAGKTSIVVRAKAPWASLDSTIMLQFCNLADGQLGLLLLTKKPFSPPGLIFYIKNHSGIAFALLALFATPFILVSCWRWRQQRTLNSAKQTFLESFRQSCADLGVDAEIETPPSKNESKKSLINLPIFRHRVVAKWLNYLIDDPNLSKFLKEITAPIQAAWQKRKQELTKLIKNGQSDVDYDTLRKGVENLCKQPGIIQQQAIKILKDRKFLFGELEAAVQNDLEQSALESLDSRLSKVEESLIELLGDGYADWNTSKEIVKKRLDAYKHAGDKLRELHLMLPVLFIPLLEGAEKAQAESKEVNVLGMLDKLAEWCQKQAKELQQKVEDVKERFQHLILLIGIKEASEHAENVEKRLGLGDLMDPDRIRSWHKSLSETMEHKDDSINFQTDLVGLAQALVVINCELKTQIEENKALQNRLKNELEQVSLLRSELAEKISVLQKCVASIEITSMLTKDQIKQFSDAKEAYENQKTQLLTVQNQANKHLQLQRKHGEDLGIQIKELQNTFETAQSVLRTEIDKQRAEITVQRQSFEVQFSAVAQSVAAVKELRENLEKEKANLSKKIDKLEMEISQKSAQYADLSKTNKELTDLRQYTSLPYEIQAAREFFVKMNPLFDGRIRGLAESSGLSDEYKRLFQAFGELSQKLRLDLGVFNEKNLDVLGPVLSKCEKNKRDFVKNYVLPLATPFCQAYQIVWHVQQIHVDLKKEFIPNYLRYRAIATELGLHLHDITVFQTKPNLQLHNERGIGCQTPTLKIIFDDFGPKKRLPAPCISDVIYLGFESAVEGIESARSEVRVFYG